MVNEIPEQILRNPKSTFLDNSAGSGNFIMALIDKLSEYHDRDYVINNMVYAVEFMEDNHQELCERVGVGVDHPHYVCYDALTYDYSFKGNVGLEDYGLGTIPRSKKYVKTINKDPSEARLPL